jgi:hypothetical protein
MDTTNATQTGAETMTTTTQQRKVTAIEMTRRDGETRRFNVFVGGAYRGMILRNKAGAVWVAYGIGGFKDELGQSKSRPACVEMIAGR